MTDEGTMTPTELRELLETPEPDVLVVDSLTADMTAIGAADTDELTATQSAIGSATVERDATLHSSAAGMLTARDVTMHQSGSLAIMAEGDMEMSQSGAGLIMARTVEVHDGVSVAVVADQANVARSWVGMAAAREISVSDDSHVIIDVRAALVIAAALLGGFALVGVALVLAGRRVADRLPRLPHADLSALRGAPQSVAHAIAQMRHAG